MANKAFGYISGLTTSGSTPPQVGFTYSVVRPDNSIAVQAQTSSGQVDYDDSPYDIWAKIVTAVRADVGDPAVIVVSAPSSFDMLLSERTY